MLHLAHIHIAEGTSGQYNTTDLMVIVRDFTVWKGPAGCHSNGYW